MNRFASSRKLEEDLYPPSGNDRHKEYLASEEPGYAPESTIYGDYYRRLPKHKAPSYDAGGTAWAGGGEGDIRQGVRGI